MSKRTEDALERLGRSANLESLAQAVRGLRDAFDVEHVVYHSRKPDGELWSAFTYDDAWVKTYVEEDFQSIDPIVTNCFRRFTPSDWKGLNWSPKPARMLLAESIANGNGNQGISLPIRGPGGQFGIFTLNHRSGDDAWSSFARDALNDLVLVAHYVNERSLALTALKGSDGCDLQQALSPRERDTLTLLASGLSRGQAAERLKISENTLRVYIESARFKLGAMNTIHAVAHAMSRGLICL